MIDGLALRQKVAKNNEEILLAVRQEEIDTLVDALIAAKRIYVAGWGRAGNCIRLLSMDASQLGLKTHIVGDNSTPSIHEGDILVIGTGSGETDTMKILADQAKEHGATLATITHGPDSYIAGKADIVVNIPSAHTREQMETLTLAEILSFYQVEVALNDVIMSLMAEKLGVTIHDELANHNNLE